MPPDITAFIPATLVTLVQLVAPVLSITGHRNRMAHWQFLNIHFRVNVQE